MAYKRIISYFDFIEDEQKRGNAGFVKWEKYDECHILSVFISISEPASVGEVKVFSDDDAIGMINIRNGRAEGTYLLTRGEKNWKEEIGEIRIPIDEKSILLAVFEEQQNAEAESRVKEKESEADTGKDEISLSVEERPEEATALIPEEAEEKRLEETEAVREEPSEFPQGLWERMRETHEPFYPFENETECYRIFPRDIKNLNAKYHALQNNQFLLHGYYNYRYLILFRKKDSENEYWLGVPGIYHEREKMAARMFGFEKFEAGKKDYRTGDLGYYLITVE